MICRNDLDNRIEKEKTKKYNFQGNSTILIHWFDIDHQWLEERFSTFEPDFYKYFLKEILGVKKQKQKNVHVPIGNVKNIQKKSFSQNHQY